MEIRYPIRWKLLISLIGLVILILGLVLIVVTQQLRSKIIEDINSTFVEKGQLFERIQQARFRQLKQTAILLADIPSLKAALATGDKLTMNQKIKEELWPILDFDPTLSMDEIVNGEFLHPDSSGLLVVCDLDGVPLGHLHSSDVPRFSIAERAGVSEALKGDYPEHASIWQSYDRYFSVITVPIWSANTLLGTLSYGHPIRQMETDQLARDINGEVTFYIENEIKATSFEGLDSEELGQFSKSIYNTAYDMLITNEPGTFFINLNDEDWLIYVTPMLPDVDSPSFIPAFYVLASSYTRAKADLTSLQFVILGMALLGVLSAVFIALILTSKFTQPIYQLVDGIKRIDAGDYGSQVPVTTKDELGLLTDRFNRLLITLKERLEMLKFVSGATLEAIRKNLTDRELGGQRKEVTVFFSDIRGFTSYSERRPPEEVISMLNKTLSVQAEIVNKYHGDVDKFVGDELVAVFEGAEKDRNAVKAAIEIQKVLREEFDSGAEKEISVGIGINAGSVVMGAMGSASRMDYTVIGNHVNLGARLCSAATKDQILISEHSVRNLERWVKLKEMEPIRVKGIKDPVNIYEVEWKEIVHESPEELEV